LEIKTISAGAVLSWKQNRGTCLSRIHLFTLIQVQAIGYIWVETCNKGGSLQISVKCRAFWTWIAICVVEEELWQIYLVIGGPPFSATWPGCQPLRQLIRPLT